LVKDGVSSGEERRAEPTPGTAHTSTISEKNLGLALKAAAFAFCFLKAKTAFYSSQKL
jgi:hypothetical protein